MTAAVMAPAGSDVSVIILCGGTGARLGGADKPLLKVDGVPIIARLSEALAPVGPVLISANRNQSSYRGYGTVIGDAPGARRGPLGGIAACLAACETRSAFVCPGDCPNVTEVLARRLLARLEDAGSQSAAPDGVVAHDGKRAQHLHLALHTDTLTDLDAYLSSGHRSVHGWLERLRMAVVDCRDQADAFADIDTKQDLDGRPR